MPVEWTEDGWAYRAERVVEFRYAGSGDLGVLVRAQRGSEAGPGALVEVWWADGHSDPVANSRSNTLADQRLGFVTVSRHSPLIRGVLAQHREAADAND